MRGIIVVMLVLTGCASPSTRFAESDQVAAQCEYESTMATQGGASPLVLGYRRQQLFVACMRAKGR